MLKIEIQVPNLEEIDQGYFPVSLNRSGVALHMTEKESINISPKLVSKNSVAVSQSRLPHHQGPLEVQTAVISPAEEASDNFHGFLGSPWLLLDWAGSGLVSINTNDIKHFM